MKQITLLHTVRSVYENFEEQLRHAMPYRDLEICNTLDEFLSVDANRKGFFSRDNRKRLFALLQAKDLEHTDLIIVTCSTLTPVVGELRPFIETPVLAIDDAMMEQAVHTGSNILVMATAGSAMGPAKLKLSQEAAKAEKHINITEMICTKAFEAIQKQDNKRHDEILLKAAGSIEKPVDAIVLAQASMAHLEKEISKRCGLPVLSSPRYCFNRAEQLLFGKVEEQ